MSNFPTKVNIAPAPAVKGDFASQNPRASMLALAGDLVAPATGLLVANFAFVQKTGAGEVASQSWSAGAEIGFLARENQGLITAYLAGDSLIVPAGFMVTLYTQGEFFAQFAGGATPGQNVYADETNGSPISAASAPAAASVTASVGTSANIAGSVAAGGLMTVTTAPTSGIISVGDTITATGMPVGTTVTALGTGTGGTGTYQLSEYGVVAAFTNGQVTNSNVINVTVVGSGTLIPGATLNSALLPANTELGAQLSGSAGGVGAYKVSSNGYPIGTPAAASGTVTTIAGIATGYFVRSFANPGELAKISTWG